MSARDELSREDHVALLCERYALDMIAGALADMREQERAALRRYEALSRRISETYELGEADRVDTVTGTIKRATESGTPAQETV